MDCVIRDDMMQSTDAIRSQKTHNGRIGQTMTYPVLAATPLSDALADLAEGSIVIAMFSNGSAPFASALDPSEC